MELAISFLSFRYEGKVRAMAISKGIEGHDLEQLVGDVFESALKSAAGHSGSHIGEFVNWIKTITKYRIADFHKTRKKSRDDVSLDGGDGEDAHAPPEPSETGAVDRSPLKFLRDELLAELPPPHRAAVICRLCGLSSKEAAARVNATSDLEETRMTPENVDQILSRFRKVLRKRYNMGGD